MKNNLSKKTLFLPLLAALVSICWSMDTLFAAQFERDLSVGSSGEDVRQLQQTLNSDPDTALQGAGVGSSGQETVYFGAITQNAVIRFQEKYRDEILTPLGLSNGTGLVGAKTREKLNALGGYSSATEPAPTSSDFESAYINKYPQITGVSMLEISDPSNTPLIIRGLNFTLDNTVFLVIEGIEIFKASIVDKQTIAVLLNTVMITRLKEAIDAIPENVEQTARKTAREALKAQFNSTGRDGVYVPATVFVKNENGESNKLEIKINILRDE